MTQAMYIDSHCHLEMREFDRDRDEAIRRAREAGVGYIITAGTTLADCRKAVRIAETHPEVYVAVGVHPHEAKEIELETYSGLKELATHKKIVAYGEIGLDFFRKLSPRQIQMTRFQEQLEIAAELNLPVIIHDRDAHAETIQIIKNSSIRKGVIHCFSGNEGMARMCIDMGFYISIPGTITFKKSERLQEVVKKVPLDRLLIETDAPYLAPEPYRGKRNEPAYVIYAARKIAALKGVSPEKVGEITARNARALFNLPNFSY